MNQIEALNQTVLNQNRQLIRSFELLSRWRNKEIMPELFQDLVSETDQLLKGGIVYGLPEESHKEGR